MRKIITSDFTSDVGSAAVLTSLDKPLHELVDAYNTELISLVDKDAPLQEKTITLRPHAPWYTEELHEAKQERLSKRASMATDKTGSTSPMVYRAVQNRVDPVVYYQGELLY